MKLVFVHGWGFDPSIWGGLRRVFAAWPSVEIDLGYFGKPMLELPEGPVLGIGHSFGAMWLLRNPPAGLRGLVAINGFDRFATQQRVMDRMVSRFGTSPHEVLSKFRERCGADAPPQDIDAERLGRDLAILRDEEERETARALGVPILSLQGSEDPILTTVSVKGAFWGVPDVKRKILSGEGHLLPLTAPDWCADLILDWL